MRQHSAGRAYAYQNKKEMRLKEVAFIFGAFVLFFDARPATAWGSRTVLRRAHRGRDHEVEREQEDDCVSNSSVLLQREEQGVYEAKTSKEKRPPSRRQPGTATEKLSLLQFLAGGRRRLLQDNRRDDEWFERDGPAALAALDRAVDPRRKNNDFHDLTSPRTTAPPFPDTPAVDDTPESRAAVGLLEMNTDALAVDLSRDAFTLSAVVRRAYKKQDPMHRFCVKAYMTGMKYDKLRRCTSNSERGEEEGGSREKSWLTQKWARRMAVDSFTEYQRFLQRHHALAFRVFEDERVRGMVLRPAPGGSDGSGEDPGDSRVPSPVGLFLSAHDNEALQYLEKPMNSGAWDGIVAEVDGDAGGLRLKPTKPGKGAKVEFEEWDPRKRGVRCLTWAKGLGQADLERAARKPPGDSRWEAMADLRLSVRYLREYEAHCARWRWFPVKRRPAVDGENTFGGQMNVWQLRLVLPASVEKAIGPHCLDSPLSRIGKNEQNYLAIWACHEDWNGRSGMVLGPLRQQRWAVHRLDKTRFPELWVPPPGPRPSSNTSENDNEHSKDESSKDESSKDESSKDESSKQGSTGPDSPTEGRRAALRTFKKKSASTPSAAQEKSPKKKQEDEQEDEDEAVQETASSSTDSDRLRWYLSLLAGLAVGICCAVAAICFLCSGRGPGSTTSSSIPSTTSVQNSGQTSAGSLSSVLAEKVPGQVAEAVAPKAKAKRQQEPMPESDIMTFGVE